MNNGLKFLQLRGHQLKRYRWKAWKPDGLVSVNGFWSYNKDSYKCEKCSVVFVIPAKGNIQMLIEQHPYYNGETCDELIIMEVIE